MTMEPHYYKTKTKRLYVIDRSTTPAKHTSVNQECWNWTVPTMKLKCFISHWALVLSIVHYWNIKYSSWPVYWFGCFGIELFICMYDEINIIIHHHPLMNSSNVYKNEFGRVAAEKVPKYWCHPLNCGHDDDVQDWTWTRSSLIQDCISPTHNAATNSSFEKRNHSFASLLYSINPKSKFLVARVVHAIALKR